MRMKLIPEKMIPDYGEEIYDKVSVLVGLKFKKQMKNSGIVFKQVFELKNLITNDKFYLLETNTTSIHFFDKDEFIQAFIVLLRKSINKLNQDYQELLEQQNQAVVDENLIFLQNERIGHCGEKQLTLLNKMREFRTVIPTQTVNDINK